MAPLPRLALLAVAIGSTLAGATLSVLPALIVGIVNLFYNSAGGVLVLLGSLISLLPHPAIPAQGSSSSLPMFQILDTGTGIVLLRSAGATILCALAFALALASRQSPSRTTWMGFEFCCALAIVAGDHPIGWVLAPALLAGAAQLAVGTARE